MENLTITDHVRAKVREIIFDSIPDDELDRMIKLEYDAFFKSGTDGYNRPKESQFKSLVRDLARERIVARTKEWMAENFDSVWDGTTEKLVGDLVAEIAPRVQEAVAYDITQRALALIRGAM